MCNSFYNSPVDIFDTPHIVREENSKWIVKQYLWRHEHIFEHIVKCPYLQIVVLLW